MSLSKTKPDLQNLRAAKVSELDLVNLLQIEQLDFIKK